MTSKALVSKQVIRIAFAATLFFSPLCVRQRMPPTHRPPATSTCCNIRQVHTRSVPWRNWDEWHQVAEALASTDPHLRSLGAQHVAAWRCRGRVPAAIDATATLTELLLYPSHRFPTHPPRAHARHPCSSSPANSLQQPGCPPTLPRHGHHTLCKCCGRCTTNG